MYGLTLRQTQGPQILRNDSLKTLEEFHKLGDNENLWQKSYIKKRSSMQ